MTLSRHPSGAVLQSFAKRLIWLSQNRFLSQASLVTSCGCAFWSSQNGFGYKHFTVRLHDLSRAETHLAQTISNVW
jgi:hypothetical protein